MKRISPDFYTKLRNKNCRKFDVQRKRDSWLVYMKTHHPKLSFITNKKVRMIPALNSINGQEICRCPIVDLRGTNRAITLISY